MSWKSFFTKQKKQDLDEGLEKTKKSFLSKIAIQLQENLKWMMKF